MTAQETIENKISTVKRYLLYLDSYKSQSVSEIKNDQTLRGAIERYLYLAIQATIDLGEAVIADRGWRKPATLVGVFEVLNENKLVSARLSDQLSAMAKFRNLIAHDYEKIDYGKVKKILDENLTDIEDFLDIVQKKYR